MEGINVFSRLEEWARSNTFQAKVLAGLVVAGLLGLLAWLWSMRTQPVSIMRIEYLVVAGAVEAIDSLVLWAVTRGHKRECEELKNKTKALEVRRLWILKAQYGLFPGDDGYSATDENYQARDVTLDVLKRVSGDSLHIAAINIGDQVYNRMFHCADLAINKKKNWRVEYVFDGKRLIKAGTEDQDMVLPA